MSDRLKTIVDLKNYPIHNLSSSKIQKLIKKCKDDLDQFSCSTISNFILPKSIEIMNLELEKKIDKVFMSKKSINPYLNSKDDPSLSSNHPKRNFMERDNGYLNSNLFEENSEMKFLYEQDELLRFVSACLGISPIYRWADPLDGKWPCILVQLGWIRRCYVFNAGSKRSWSFQSCSTFNWWDN